MLHFLNVKKIYGTHAVIDMPSLQLASGIYWLRGANGSGKSTFLKMAGGLIPFEGEITIDDIHLKRNPTEYRRAVSYVEAEPLYPYFVSGLDLVHFFTYTRKADKKSTDQLVEAIGIGRFYKDPIGTYSSGMVKKLSLVLAFIGQCRFIFLDEPLVTLDQAAVETLYQLIGEYHREGTGFIITSHQLVEHHYFNPTELHMKDQSVCFQ
ncbi:MAG: ABC transporter ATP-binding protein [Bacteroidetes bacterium]|nr:ABC transporter ATP-binding protein [Bacteroidota bacterium]